VLFIGLYFDQDYITYVNHQGPITVFWNGADVTILAASLPAHPIIKSQPARHFCHNEQLRDELAALGITATIHPLFFWRVEDYPISFKPSKPIQVYLSANSNREEESGLNMILRVAQKMLEVQFHIYATTGLNTSNVTFHGWVPDEEFDAAIRKYHSCLRLKKHDGFSQTVMKSILLGQYPILYKNLPGIWQATNEQELIACLERLKEQTTPNHALRERYIDQFNENLDWVQT